jgi:hypothetical protein
VAIKIGTISISLSAETASFQAGMEKASQVALNSSRNIERSFNMMGAAIAAATGAAVGALGILIEKTEDTVFQMQKMAQQAGVSMESFSKLAYAAKTAGMPIDQMAVILTRISRSSYEAAAGNKQAAQAYNALGVSVTDANGHFKTADQLAIEVSKSLDKYRDSAGKTGIETLIMGRSGAQAASFMSVLANRFDETSATAQKLGVVFSEQTAKGAQALHESLINIEEAGLGLSVRLLSAVTPALNDLASKIIDLVNNADRMKQVEAIGDDIAVGIHAAGEAMKFMVDHAEAMKIILGSLVAIRIGGIFGPMIASASGASGVMGKLGLAALNLTGNLLGIRKLGNILGPVASGALESAESFAALSGKLGVASTASLYFTNAMEAARAALATTLGTIGVIAAGIGIFTKAVYDNKTAAEVSAHMAVTWADMWHGAIDNVMEDFHDLGALIKAVMTGDWGAALGTMKWTSLPDAAANEAKLRQFGVDARPKAPGVPSDYKWDQTEAKKDIPNPAGPEKVDELQKRLDELAVKAKAARQAVALVGASPHDQQMAEVNEKTQMFMVENIKLLRDKTAAQQKDVEMKVHNAYVDIISSEATAKYNKALLDLKGTLSTSTQEHLAMAAATGMSAQAMQNAVVAAKVNQEMQKMGGIGWQQDPKMVEDSLKVRKQITDELNASNLQSDAQTLASQKLQIAEQERLNKAILQGVDARRDAAVESEKERVRQDFATRGDIGSPQLSAQIEAIQRKADAEREAGDLEKAASMDSVLKYQEQTRAISDAVDAAQQYGRAIDYREVMAANKQAWLEFMGAQDKTILETGDAIDGLKVALSQLARDTESSAQMMHDAVLQAIGSMNDAIAKVMTEKHHRGDHMVRNTFSGAARGIGGDLAKRGLQKAEQAALAKFGFGGKPDGTSSNPLHTVVMNLDKMGGAGAGMSGLASKLGSKLGGQDSALGNILGTLSPLLPFQGFFADGTDSLVPGMASIVGERGPELFVPPSSGTIVPNHKLGGLGGGHTINIDARHSTDPAQTAMMVREAIRQAAPHIAGAAVTHINEHIKRNPHARS